MELELSEQHKMFRQAIMDFAEKEIAPLVEEAEEREQFPKELFRKMGSLGYLCVRFPALYGGAEMDKLAECILVEETAKICSGISSGFMVQSGIGSELILEHGDDQQKLKYIVPAIKGEKIGCFGLTEANAGSDAASIETTAVKKDGYYLVNGSKIFITNGPIADYVIVAAYTDKSKGARRGVSVIVVDKGTPGFTIARKLNKVGNRSAETGELAFVDCRVPQENLIGVEGMGFPYLMNTLGGGRISHAFRSIGVAEAALEASVKYAQERVQFGQPIGKFQAISFKLARMAMEIEAARWLGYRATWLFDQNLPFMKEAAMAKLFASEVCLNATSEAMQIHGGYGYMMDSPIQRYFRDAKLFTITEGTSEIQQTVIAREIGLRF